MSVAYRIIEVCNGNIKTLFHGINGSRNLTLGKWITSDKKLVRDGTSKTFYYSGFHVLMSIPDCIHYLSKFKVRLDKLKIARVSVRGEMRRKSHSNHPVFLAEEMRVDEILY